MGSCSSSGNVDEQPQRERDIPTPAKTERAELASRRELNIKQRETFRELVDVFKAQLTASQPQQQVQTPPTNSAQPTRQSPAAASSPISPPTASLSPTSTTPQERYIVVYGRDRKQERATLENEEQSARAVIEQVRTGERRELLKKIRDTPEWKQLISERQRQRQQETPRSPSSQPNSAKQPMEGAPSPRTPVLGP